MKTLIRAFDAAQPSAIGRLGKTGKSKGCGIGMPKVGERFNPSDVFPEIAYDPRTWFQLVAKLSGSEAVLAIPRVYIEATGSLKTALVLSQILYYTQKLADEDGWFWMSHKQWTEETFLSRHEVDSAIEYLKDQKILETVLRKVGGAPTLHYRVLIGAFRKWICEFFANGNVKNSQMDMQKIDKSYKETKNSSQDLLPKDTPLTPQGEFWNLSRDQHLADPEINYPQIWNDLVPEAPVRWNWAKDKLHKDCADREFKTGFRDLCKKASAIHKARGDKAKWLTFRNLFTKNPQTKIPKWRNLLLGEYDFLLHGFPEEKPQEVAYKSFEEVFREQDNPTPKKYPRSINPFTGKVEDY